jgi:hypothetical protein
MQLEQTVKGGEGHNEYWPLGQGPVKARPHRHKGKSPFPYTPPYTRVRTGRFCKAELTRGAGESIRLSEEAQNVSANSRTSDSQEALRQLLNLRSRAGTGFVPRFLQGLTWR